MPPSPPTTTPKFRSGRSANASLWPTTINPHQPPCFEHLGSAVATLLSTATSPTTSPYLRVRKGVAPQSSAPYHRRPHQPPEVEFGIECEVFLIFCLGLLFSLVHLYFKKQPTRNKTKAIIGKSIAPKFFFPVHSSL